MCLKDLERDLSFQQYWLLLLQETLKATSSVFSVFFFFILFFSSFPLPFAFIFRETHRSSHTHLLCLADIKQFQHAISHSSKMVFLSFALFINLLLLLFFFFLKCFHHRKTAFPTVTDIFLFWNNFSSMIIFTNFDYSRDF